MSTFDPDTFLQTAYKDATDDKLIPADEGEYLSQISKVVAKKITSKEGIEYLLLDLSWHILDEEVKKKTGLDKPFARQSIFLDLTESGNLDMGKGKNVALGKLRTALRQNSSGKPWSPTMMVGMSAWTFVKQDPDATNPEIIRNTVVRVAEKRSESSDKKKAA